MKEVNKIDDLLKSSFENFEATPPSDAWSSIQQSIPKSSLVQTASAVKSASVISKIILAVASSVAVLGGSYFVYHYFNNTTETAQQKSVHQNTAPLVLEQKENQTVLSKEQKAIDVESKIPAQNIVKEKSNKQLDDETSSQVIKQEELKTAPSSSIITTNINEPKSSVIQAQQTPQKSVLPKPKHPSNPESNNVSNSASTDQNNDIKLEIENIISPNGDGLNDIFKIKFDGETSYYDLKVFDRKNNLVFQSDSKEKEWNGTKMNSGDLCEEGDYFYEFNYRLKNSERVYTNRGSIKIIR